MAAEHLDCSVQSTEKQRERERESERGREKERDQPMCVIVCVSPVCMVPLMQICFSISFTFPLNLSMHALEGHCIQYYLLGCLRYFKKHEFIHSCGCCCLQRNVNMEVMVS